MRQIFTPAIGQYDNIGDILLRRPLLDWLRPAGELHVFIGPAPRGYAAALGLQPQDHVYRSFGAWYLAGLAGALAGRASYAFKPGEIQLTLKGMKEHVSVLPLLALLRLRGGRVVRVGSGARNFARWPRWLLWPSMALSNLVLWRDGRTAEHLACGAVMPDLAFGYGDGDGDAAPSAGDRPWLIVSMRGDRQGVSEAWVAAVRGLAQREGLRIRVVTQVARDADLSRELCRRLEADSLPWDGQDHDLQEERLRQAYRASRVAVSDRLHVLIAAFTHGAVPIGLLVDRSDKIARHFAAAGVASVDVMSDGRAPEAVIEAMRAVLKREHELFAGLARARVELQGVRGQVLRCLAEAAG